MARTHLIPGSIDPLMHATTSLVMLGVVLLATWVRARRASRIEPVIALRSN